MAISQTTILESSVRRLFPNIDREQAFAELLLERAQKNLIKYQAALRHFEGKYGQDFESYREKVIGSDPDEESEQDYFDWEMAVTGSEDMRDEIERLNQLLVPT